MPAHVTRLGYLLAAAVIAIAALAPPAVVTAAADDLPAATVSVSESPIAKGTTDDNQPLVSFTGPDSITEGEPAVFTFTRTGDLSDALALNLDFFFEGEFLQSDEMPEVWFAAGEAEAVLSIPTVDDSTPEPDGSIAVHLQKRYFHPDPNYPQPYDLQAPVYLQVTVLDND